jgi:hypothetical protein
MKFKKYAQESYAHPIMEAKQFGRGKARGKKNPPA